MMPWTDSKRPPDPAPFAETSVNGMGDITRPLGTSPVDPVDGAGARTISSSTRLKIPAIAHEECLTGFTTFGATVFPTPLALAATFDPEGVDQSPTAASAPVPKSSSSTSQTRWRRSPGR